MFVAYASSQIRGQTVNIHVFIFFRQYEAAKKESSASAVLWHVLKT